MKSFWGAVTAVLMMLMGMVVAAPAMAAPTFATTATVTDLAFTKTTVTTGSMAQLNGSWSLPDNPTAPAGFALALPADLHGQTENFDLRDAAGGAMGSCEATATELVCTMDEAYITKNPKNIAGKFSLWVRVDTKVTEKSEQTYTIGGATATITVLPGSTCTQNCFAGEPGSKGGTYQLDTNLISWVIRVPGPATGMVGGETVTVTDRPDALQTIDMSSIKINGTNVFGSDGKPTQWRDVTAALGAQITTVDGKPQISFTSQPGWLYRVMLTAKPTDGGAAGVYQNSADIVINGGSTQVVTGSATRRGGGGTGSGDPVGRFSITKDVAWSDQAVDGQNYAGTFTVTEPGGTVHTGDFAVAEGETWTSGTYLAGSTVRIQETLPTEPANIDWATPVFSQNDFAIAAGTTVAATLTNTATVATGSFEITKALTGSGAALVPADQMFVIEYSYPAGTGFSADSGTIELPADGTTVRSPQLPVGAEVTLTEVTPDAIGDAVWEAPRWSTSSLVIEREGVESVTVTNELNAFGDFSITKDVVWESVPVAGLTFSGTYSVTTPDDVVTTGTFEIAEDGTWTSERFPAGSVVQLEEILPSEPLGLDWAAPAWSANNFEVGTDETTAVTLTNTASNATNAFTAAKQLTGTGASLVASDAVFVLEYSYPAGTGFEAGSGTLELPADGTVVTSPQLPVGAQVTLSEVAPDAIAGATWSDPVLSVTSLEIGRGDAVAVTVTNELTRDEVPTTPKVDEPLLATGGGVALVSGLLGLALAVAGGALLVLRRRTA